MMPVPPALLSGAVTRSGAFTTAAKSTSRIDGGPKVARDSSSAVPSVSPAASTPTSRRYAFSPSAIGALEKRTVRPAEFRARASATLLKAPWRPSLPSGWIGCRVEARSSSARSVGCAASGSLPSLKFHCRT